MMLLLILFFISFTAISWRRYEFGLFLFFFLLPTYLIRFTLFGVPSTMLEGMFVILFFTWMLQKQYAALPQKLALLKRDHKGLLIGTALFIFAATISMFTAVELRAAAGMWKAFFVEPVMLGIMLLTAQRKHIKAIVFGVLSIGMLTSLFAIYQHFTGFFVPWAFWENGDSYRVTGWYGFPNGVGLFLAPLIPLALFVVEKNWKKNMHTFVALFFITAATLAVIYAKSTGGLIGIAAGFGFLLLTYKKTRITAIAIGVIALGTLFALPAENPIKKEVLAQDRSGQIRIAMWGEATQLLSEHPLAGAGLASYEERIEPYHALVHGERIEIFHHPHNIFLTMWVNTGLVGLIGFVWIVVWCFRAGLQQLKRPAMPYLLASLVVILTTGLVDSPYIKNDLAMFFWMLVALLVIHIQPRKIFQTKKSL